MLIAEEIVRTFISERCENTDSSGCKTEELYADYRKLFEGKPHGIGELSKIRFGIALKKNGLKRVVRRGYSVWVGIKLRETV